MKTKIFLHLLAFAFTPTSAFAAPRAVTFAVQNMTCAVCQITVKKALEQVSGVHQVSVDYASNTYPNKFSYCSFSQGIRLGRGDLTKNILGLV